MTITEQNSIFNRQNNQVIKKNQKLKSLSAMAGYDNGEICQVESGVHDSPRGSIDEQNNVLYL